MSIVSTLTINLPESITTAINARNIYRFGQSGVVEDAILHGLAQPVSVKRDLRRDHIVGRDVRQAEPMSTLTTICLTRDTYMKVAAHMNAYGLPSMAEAVRELLRLGFDLPQPEPRQYLETKRRAQSVQWMWQAPEKYSTTVVQQVSGLSVNTLKTWLGWPRPGNEALTR